MTHSSIDHEALFRQVTGREMRREDADELRRLRAHMPGALASSPSYNFDLIVKYYQVQQFRAVVASGTEAIVDDVEYQSKAAVARIVDDAVKRIQAASPSVEAARYHAILTMTVVVFISSLFAAAAILVGLGKGWIAPNWLTEEAAYKVQWADAVEERIGPGAVDWAMRQGRPDESLLEILEYIKERGTPGDPVRQLSEFKRCRAPGQVAYRYRGRPMCRFEATNK